jgi:hypothetical protein
MRGLVTISVALLSTSLLAQKGAQSLEIERAKQAIISSFDPALPNLTLESFLRYETHNAPTEWQTNGCKEYPLYLAETQRGNAVCVESYSSLRDRRVLKVTLGLTRNNSTPPRILSVALIKDGLVEEE